MLLVVGGAYAGKRRIVQEQIINKQDYSWLSAYNGAKIDHWKMKWKQDSTLVLEGWEVWIEEILKEAAIEDSRVEDVREKFQLLFHSLVKEEKKLGGQVILIMLEIGRGVVPIEAEQRKLRDLAGWILQDAAAQSTEVLYVWNGLVKQLK